MRFVPVRAANGSQSILWVDVVPRCFFRVGLREDELAFWIVGRTDTRFNVGECRGSPSRDTDIVKNHVAGQRAIRASSHDSKSTLPRLGGIVDTVNGKPPVHWLNRQNARRERLSDRGPRRLARSSRFDD